MICINDLVKYFFDDCVFITLHAKNKIEERQIKIRDIKNAVINGEIIEQYPDDYPYPSCLICGKTLTGEVMHIVMSDEGHSSRIITAYYPASEKWTIDFKRGKKESE